MTGSLSHGLGRFLLGLYFFLPGLMKFAAWDGHIAMMQAQDVPLASVGLLASGAVSIIGALLLWSNRYVRLVAFGFVAYIVLVNFFMHDFWLMEAGEAAQRETQNFVKNLGILAGLLVLAGSATKRKLSLKSLARADAKAG